MVIGKCTDVFRGIFGLGGEVEGGTMWKDFSMEELVVGEENFNEEGAGFSSIIKKKQGKNKYEKFLQQKVGSSIIT